MQQMVSRTHVSQEIVSYIVSLIRKTREHPQILRGASPRATLAVVSVSKALARLHGRDFVIPQDVQNAFPQTVAHRLELNAKASSIPVEQVLQSVMQAVAAPRI